MINRSIRISISILLILFFAIYEKIFSVFEVPEFWINSYMISIKNTILWVTTSWLIIELVRFSKIKLLENFDITKEDNLQSRKYHTQINLLEKVVISLIILITLGLIMISIESIREIGMAIFASAGVIGIVVGLSAQKIFGAILAGIQIAITQPFRIDDAVVVENEWGWIEEINLTYIVIKLWDKRRLVLPTTYFLEKPFQNWTRTNADIIGTVFIYTDYSITIDAMRKELDRILEKCELWDGKVKVIQVTDTKENYVESRILVSAKNSPTAWDLRVYVREKMIEFIRDYYPDSLPRTRVNLVK